MEAIIDELIEACTSLYRKIAREKGPLDRLQTREFRALIEGVNQQDPQCLFWLNLLYATPLHFQEGLSLLGEIPSPIKKVLDLSPGLSPYGLAACYHGARSITHVGDDEKKLSMAAEIFGKMGFPYKPLLSKNPSFHEEKYDLIILNRSLFLDNRSIEEIVHSLTAITRYLNDEGFILIAEDTHQESLDRFLALRDHLAHADFPIQAPCVFRGDCPARKAKAPCYAQRPFYKPHLLKEIQRGLEINLSSLKMAYLLLRNPKMGWPKLPDNPLYRVISPPIETLGKKRFYLCGTDGKKNLGSRLEEHPKKSRAFEYLKRGELISLKDVLQNKSFIDIVQESEVTVEAPLGKPLPSTDF
jgi:hypothetical protein